MIGNRHFRESFQEAVESVLSVLVTRELAADVHPTGLQPAAHPSHQLTLQQCNITVYTHLFRHSIVSGAGVGESHANSRKGPMTISPRRACTHTRQSPRQSQVGGTLHETGGR